jgi:ankyrin repeat protein
MKKVSRAIAVAATLVVCGLSAFGQAGAGSLNNRLVKAAGEGDTASVLRLLRQGAKINAVNSDGWTALENAVVEGKIEAVRLLLDKGAKIEVGGAMSYSPLTLAAEKGYVEIVKLLLDKGANIEARNMVSGTALDDAAGKGQTEVVRLLLDRGANGDARAMMGFTAVFEAALAGNGEIVKMLVAKGADVNAKFGGDDPNRTALSEAIERGNAQAVKILVENGANLEAKDDKGHTPLEKAGNYYDQKSFYTSMYKDSDYAGVVKVLLESGAALPKNKDGYGSGYLIAARDLPSPPGPNPAARKLFTMATEQIKQASTPEALVQPIALLRKAVSLAPWWANAYYNLSHAWEADGNYDDAIKQLNYYLELKPSETDVADARSKIAVIQAEKDAAERKRQEKEATLAVQYVGSGVTRLRWKENPAWWNPSNGSTGVNGLYVYYLDEEGPFDLNVFRFPNGRLIAICLIARSNNGAYGGDQIGVYDITDSTIYGGVFDFGEQNYTQPNGYRYDVSVTTQPNSTVTVKSGGTASVTLPVALLYRARARKAGCIFGGKGCAIETYQAGHQAMLLKFDVSVVDASYDPNANAAGLTPISVTPVH